MVEPGKNVIEIRSGGMHKGKAVDVLVDEVGAGGFLFAGDDLGDVEAFEAVARAGAQGAGDPAGRPPRRRPELDHLADVVVTAPRGCCELLRRLTEDARDLRA